MGPEEIFSQLGLLMVNFFSSTLHLLPRIYPIFTCVDLISIRIHNTAEDRFSLRQNQQWT